jgi:predicted NAD/FAD-dependent oxidoreductase
VVFALSGARAAVDAGADATGAAVAAQALAQFPGGHWTDAPRVVAVMAERRATFRCTPGLRRPGAEVAPGLAAAGDYVAGPYPATLEGAVRSGKAAVARLVA